MRIGSIGQRCCWFRGAALYKKCQSIIPLGIVLAAVCPDHVPGWSSAVPREQSDLDAW
jgi:hypothetical protein